MIIGGFEPFSLLDYPDKVAAIIFTQGCNFRCRYCYNPSLIEVSTKGGYELSQLWSFLAERQGLVEAIVITGGEPTLQKDLVEVIKEIKLRGFLIKLDTNGTNPAIVKDLIAQNLIDYLAVDVKAPWSKYDQIMALPEAVLASLVANVQELVTWLINKSPIHYEFRTTLVPGLLGLQDIAELAKELKGAQHWYLQRGRLDGNLLDSGLAGQPPFTEVEMNNFLAIAQAEIRGAAIR